MDFARKQLEKYGWSEGKGLGRNENGIATPLKPKLKFDNSGVGHDVGEQFTNNWWEKIFNNAADNINVEVDSAEVKMSVKDTDFVEITTKSYSVKQLKKNKSLEYGSFLKTSKLTDSGVENYKMEPVEYTEPLKSFQGLTDEELFAACGGRTAHKGARHGLKLSGKLSRIEKQEKMLLKKMRQVSLSDDTTKVEKKLKKLKKQKEESTEKYTQIPEESTSSSNSPLKRKNKKRKSVSFNETVTKIYTVDLDTSFDSEVASLKDENSNDPIGLDNNASGSDEGIEQDLENNNNEQEDNHRAFEEARFNFSDLSKAERKKLKKKRKLEAKLNNSTGRFLQRLADEQQDETMEDEKEHNSKKRKHLEEHSDGTDSKRCQSETDFPDRVKSKKNKKKRKKQRKVEEKQIKLEEKQMNSITKSLDSFCRISECE